jgi:DNA-binding NtrC family response regulator
MKEKILIVEDQFVEADYLRMMLTKAGYRVTGIAYSVIQAREMIKQERPDMVLLDIFVKGKLTGIDLAKELSAENIAFVYLSANSNEEVLHAAKATHPYGFLVKPFREKDLLIMLEIARYRHEHSVESGLRKDGILNDKLPAIISGADSWDTKIFNVCKTLQAHIPYDYMTVGFNSIVEAPDQALSFLRIGFDEYQKIGVPELLTMTGLKMKDLEAMVKDNFSSLHSFLSENFGMKSCASLSVQLSQGRLFTFSVYSRNADAYTADYTALSGHLQKATSGFIEGIFNERQIKSAGTYQRRSASEPAAGTQGFEGIIGRSPALLTVFDHITLVAPTETSVLILGESGTGKERIADCIHNLSSRKGKPFVKVNCAALPATLIESELFGHEKGSFTGATDKRIGKFEKADQGTIFLDEIGEMPLDLQVKLLRVLQEKYIERIGSRDITKIDVRVIAATNRNLEKEVAEGRFRLDLYYRLNVFPVELPPLRERTEDIPALAGHFINYYNRKSGKRVTGLSDKVLKNMTSYAWPGNIRELENLIERNVLLAKGATIEEMIMPANQKKGIQETNDTHVKTIYENERAHIITVLKKCDGRVWGPGGAAEMLNVLPSTLKSKMKKLGIKKDYIE